MECLAAKWFGLDYGHKPLAVSVVMGVRNRKGFRLQNTLKTLLNQSMPRERYEILVVDFGGEDRLQEWLQGLDPDIKYLHCPEKGAFHEARAKNIGIRQAKAEIVCCTNADVLFGKNFLDVVYLAGKPARRVLVECNRFNLELEDVERLGERLPEEFVGLVRKEKAWMSSWARGDCQAFRKEFMLALGGYDEDFRGWGYLDHDLERRCVEQAGWSLSMVNCFTLIAHQGHETTSQDREGNRRVFEEKKTASPLRNQGRTWGKC